MARKGSRRSVPNRPSLNNTKKPSAAKNEITHHLGLHLTVGALILIGAAWLFAIVVEDVVNHESMTLIDLQVAAYLYARATPLLTIVMTFISYFGAPAVTSSIAFATGIVLWRRRYSYRLLALVIAVPGGMLFNVLIKYIVHRPRPFFDNPLLTLTGYSFPSGHAMASMVYLPRSRRGHLQLGSGASSPCLWRPR
jgi:membrane-associated phospholipid phosphatase